MVILGIETTCDETGVGVVRDGQTVLANVVSSSAQLARKYMGVVPEVAAREQTRCIIPVINQAIYDAARISNKIQGQEIIKWAKENIDAIAVAHGPGLVGSLLVGTETAKTLALVWNRPLIAVNHLMGHVYANWLTVNSSQLTVKTSVNREPRTVSVPEFPLIALIVSGGHTDLLLMKGHGKYRWLGGTRDDAAGEAFDKVARLLGLRYPGGPEIERVASKWKMVNGKSKIVLPRPMINSSDFDFSFSGLKTAVVNLVKTQEHLRGESSSHLEGEITVQIAYEFQQAIIDVLVTKTMRTAKKFNVKSIVVGGGVAANERLRSQFVVHGLQLGISVFFPPKDLAIDNGAMIATVAFRQKNFVDPLILQADPALHFGN